MVYWGLRKMLIPSRRDLGISVEVCWIHQVCENQTCCNLIFADLLQVVETTCIKLVDKKSWQSTCSKPVDNLQQTCNHQPGASDANASWYRLDDSKATSLQQTWCNVRVSVYTIERFSKHDATPRDVKVDVKMAWQHPYMEIWRHIHAIFTSSLTLRRVCQIPLIATRTFIQHGQ